MVGYQEANPKTSASITSNNFLLAKISHVFKPKNNGTFIKIFLTLSRVILGLKSKIYKYTYIAISKKEKERNY